MRNETKWNWNRNSYMRKFHRWFRMNWISLRNNFFGKFFLSFRVNVSGLHDEKQRINVFWVVLCIFRSQFSLLHTKENLLFLGNREKCEKFLFRLCKIETLVMNYWWGLYLLCTWMEINFFSPVEIDGGETNFQKTKIWLIELNLAALFPGI